MIQLTNRGGGTHVSFYLHNSLRFSNMLLMNYILMSRPLLHSNVVLSNNNEGNTPNTVLLVHTAVFISATVY